MSMAAPSIQPQQPASSSEASTGSKEHVYGIRTEECTVSKCKGRWSMEWGMAEETAPVIGIDDAVAAARAEWKSAIRPAHRLLDFS